MHTHARTLTHLHAQGKLYMEGWEEMDVGDKLVQDGESQMAAGRSTMNDTLLSEGQQLRSHSCHLTPPHLTPSAT